MKLIKVIEKDCEEYINPTSVKKVKVTKSDLNRDWCISIYHNSHGNYSDFTTILCKTEAEKDERLEEILNAIENTL